MNTELGVRYSCLPAMIELPISRRTNKNTCKFSFCGTCSNRAVAQSLKSRGAQLLQCARQLKQERIASMLVGMAFSHPGDAKPAAEDRVAFGPFLPLTVTVSPVQAKCAVFDCSLSLPSCIGTAVLLTSKYPDGLPPGSNQADINQYRHHSNAIVSIVPQARLAQVPSDQHALSTC